MTQAHPIPDSALAAHLAILGKTGAGKTYAARSTVERILYQGGRACIVDPTGVWWGLRLGGDGKGRSRFPAVIAGGRHGDVALAEADGPALAKIVGTTSTPLILDVSAMTVGARTRFFTAFAEALLIENVGPLHLVLDEAHLFAPQTRVQDPSSAAMVHAANNLVALGRARGLRIMLLTQRPAKLHKDSLTQVETLVAMRLVAPQDRKAVEDWIAGQADKKQGAEIIASLPGLALGEAWIWAPTADVLKRDVFPTIATFDSMRPEAQGVRELPPVDVAAIRAALAPDDTKSDDAPKTSRKARRTEDITAEIAAAEQRAYERGYAEGYREAKDIEGRRLAHRQMLRVIESLAGAAMLNGDADALHAAHGRMKAIKVGDKDEHNTQSGSARLDRPEKLDAEATKSTPSRATPAPTEESGAGTPSPELSGPQRQLLSAVLWWEEIGISAPSRAQAAAIAGWRVSSGHLKNVAGTCRSAGLLAYPTQGALSLTDAGRSAAPAPDAPDALLDRVRAVLTGPQRQVLDVLVNYSGRPIARDDIAGQLGWEPTSGHLKNVVGSLRTMELVEYPAAGSVCAVSWLMAGRP